MQTMIENYINGNLTAAKIQATRYGFANIYEYCRNELGWTIDKSDAVTSYLKGKGTFQRAADAE